MCHLLSCASENRIRFSKRRLLSSPHAQLHRSDCCLYLPSLTLQPESFTPFITATRKEAPSSSQVTRLTPSVSSSLARFRYLHLHSSLISPRHLSVCCCHSCLHAYVYACVHMYTDTCMSLCILIYIYVCTQIYIYTHTVYVYVHIYISYISSSIYISPTSLPSVSSLCHIPTHMYISYYILHSVLYIKYRVSHNTFWPVCFLTLVQTLMFPLSPPLVSFFSHMLQYSRLYSSLCAYITADLARRA